MTQAFMAEFEACLEMKGKPPMEHFLELMAIISQYNMMYTLNEVHAKHFLIHMSKREELLVSPHNAHNNGADI